MLVLNNKNNDNSPNKNIQIYRDTTNIDKNMESAENIDDVFLMIEVNKNDDKI